MATVFIPAQLRDLTDGVDSLELNGKTILEVISQLDEKFPGAKDRLTRGDQLRPGLAVSIGDQIASQGLYESVPADAEVHFIPALGGG